MRAHSTVIGLSLVLVIAGLAPVVAADHDADRTVSEDYVGVPPTTVFNFAIDTPAPAPDAGGIDDVPIEADDQTVSVTIDDDLDTTTLGILAFYDENDGLIYGTGFCDSVDHHTIPRNYDGYAGDDQDADHLDVYVSHNAQFEFWGWNTDCDANVPSTSGTVTLGFTK